MFVLLMLLLLKAVLFLWVLSFVGYTSVPDSEK